MYDDDDDDDDDIHVYSTVTAVCRFIAIEQQQTWALPDDLSRNIISSLQLIKFSLCFVFFSASVRSFAVVCSFRRPPGGSLLRD